MRSIRNIAIAAALVASTALAIAQGSAAQNGGTGPDASSNKEGQVPGPNAPASADTASQVPSVQPAPGAMPDSDTVPSTLSAENAAHDKLPTVAFRMFTVTDEEKRGVHAALKGAPETAGAARAGGAVAIGTELPQSIVLTELPADVGSKVPVLQGAKFVRTGDVVLLVEPKNRIVFGVLK